MLAVETDPTLSTSKPISVGRARLPGLPRWPLLWSPRAPSPGLWPSSDVNLGMEVEPLPRLLLSGRTIPV